MKKVFLITLLVLILDQVVKLYVKSTMHLGQDGLDLGFLAVDFIENTGMATGARIPFLSPDSSKIALSLLRFVAIFGIIFYIKKNLKRQPPFGFLLAFAFILAGAIGNLIDGAFYGIIFDRGTTTQLIDGDVVQLSYNGVAQFFGDGGGYAPFMMGSVVDMLKFTVPCPEWLPWYGASSEHLLFPFVFNIADAAITTGVLMIIIWQKKYFKPVNEEIPAVVAGNNTITSSTEEE